jgi:hypothetical protein
MAQDDTTGDMLWVLRFPISVASPHRWTAEHRARWMKEAPRLPSDQWVVNLLDERVRLVMDDYIGRHPDLFKIEVVT